MNMTLTADQQAGYDALCRFILDPAESVFVLEGHSGTGKTTLLRRVLDAYPKLIKTLRLVNPNARQEYEIKLTATTNKACEALQLATGGSVSTVHSVLGLRVVRDYQQGTTHLTMRTNAKPLEDTILVIDEASYVDDELMHFIDRQTRRCKIIFVGDPSQLLNVNCKRSPVFSAGFPTARLTQVVRQQQGNPVIDLVTQLRQLVETGNWFQFTPDGHYVQHLSRPDWEQAVMAEFTDPTRNHNDSRVLAWTNKAVITYNRGISQLTTGTPFFQKGDYAVVNSHISLKGHVYKTDETVQITAVSDPIIGWYGTPGRRYTLNGRHTLFMPDHYEDRKTALVAAKQDDNHTALADIQDAWVDLREAYAVTINKSQGSTYQRVYVDLDDVARCRDPNQLARLLYVGISRASQQVFLTGDL